MRCSFTPYEGNEKYIFVSYSHSNSDKVAPILEKLNDEGFRIWYDEGIEWGTEWPESIASHLRECEICMAFHSKASIVSPNCRQEINYALKMKKGILSVYLEEVELSDGMDMQLTSFQSTFPHQYEDLEEFYIKLINTRMLQCCKPVVGQLKIQAESTGTIESSMQAEKHFDLDDEENVYSFDKEMDVKFKELFGDSREESETSLLVKKITEIKKRNFVDLWAKNIREYENDEQSDYFDDSISLIPIEYQSIISYSGNVSWTGKSFAFPNISGYKTIVFQIQRNVDYKTMTEYYTCELLDSSQHSLEDDNSTETLYHVDFPQSDGNDLIFLHFSENKGIFVNTGLLIGDKISISKEPSFLRYSGSNSKQELNLNSVAYDLHNLSEEEFSLVKGEDIDNDEIWRDADMEETVVIVIDPDTALPVQREIYFDEVTKKWKAKIKLIRNKSYFAFRVSIKGGNSPVQVLSNLEIAKYYKEGLFGFPKDIFKAVDYFEKDGTAESLYEIAVLFRTEKAIYDRELYMNYLHQAIEMGCEKAVIEFVLWMFFISNTNNKDQAKILLQNIKEEVGLRDFVIGYLIENKFFNENYDEAYHYYVKAAINGYEPACARLGSKKINFENENLKRIFIENLNRGFDISNYCMGCILFYGLGILPQKLEGVQLLEKSAENGNKMAAKVLYNIYSTNRDFFDTNKSLKWLKLIAREDSILTNELANRLWDGIGCEVNEENDRLAFEVLQKAAKDGDRSAQHNLGWAYKMGRGCEVNYLMAHKLFRDAGKPNSFYHLGDMYERGLGVQTDLCKAIEYYKKGAEKESKKAIKRLEELNKH